MTFPRPLFRLSICSLIALAMTCICLSAFGQEISKRHQRMFDRFDTNQNGQLDQSELPDRLQKLAGFIDTDQDKSISIAEFGRMIAKRRDGPQLTQPDPNRKQPQPDNYYGSKDNKSEIENIEKLMLKDKQRNKQLQIRLTFPQAGGPYPVIVFSHGLYGSKDHYSPLTEFWAANGYVVIQANHADSMALGTRLGDPRALMAWNERPGDISFVIDSLKHLADNHEQLKGKIDFENVGVGGHSFGANTTQLIAGAVATQGRTKQKFDDPRVDAALLMSGQGPGEILTKDSWKDLTKPMMVMSGSKDGPTRTGQPATWRKQPYELSPAGDKYLVWIDGLDHGFGDITNSKRLPYNAEHIAYTQATTLAFWDYYLKQSESGKSYLRNKQITSQTDGTVQLDWK